MSKVEELARQYGEELDNVLAVGTEDDNSVGEYAQKAYIAGYHQAEKDIKEELSKLFREFMMDCINDSTDTHILHFVEVFNNKIKTIGNE